MGFKDWCIVLVLVSSAGFIGMTMAVISPVLPLIIEHFGGAVHGALIGQWILAMPSIGIIIGGPATGWVVERLGTRHVLLSSFAIYALAGAAGLFVEDPYLFLGTRLILGLAAAGQVTAGATVIAELYATSHWRGRILGFQVGFGCAMSVAAILAAGALGKTQGWRAPFELYLVPFAMLLLGAFVLPAASRTHAKESDARGISAFMPLLPFYGLVIGTFIVSFFNAGAVPRLLAIDGFTSPVIISRVLGATLVLLVAGSLSYGWIRERIGVRLTFVVGLGLQGAGVLWIAIAHGVIGIGLGTAVLNLGSGIQLPNLSHLIIDHAPAAIRGRAMGLNFTAQFLGPILSTLIVAPAMDEFGIRNTLAIVGALIAACVAGIILRAHSTPPVTEHHS
jgi:MFS family permease